tara:strand:+ start:1053 stop:1247 length:195 start_codon:yes stop_codon:yes gene_type:complete
MNLQERLQQLAQERQNLQIAMIEITGAMKILEQQILEAEPVSTPPSDTTASKQPEETGSSKSKA